MKELLKNKLDMFIKRLDIHNDSDMKSEIIASILELIAKNEISEGNPSALLTKEEADNYRSTLKSIQNDQKESINEVVKGNIFRYPRLKQAVASFVLITTVVGLVSCKSSELDTKANSTTTTSTTSEPVQNEEQVIDTNANFDVNDIDTLKKSISDFIVDARSKGYYNITKESLASTSLKEEELYLLGFVAANADKMDIKTLANLGIANKYSGFELMEAYEQLVINVMDDAITVEPQTKINLNNLFASKDSTNSLNEIYDIIAEFNKAGSNGPLSKDAYAPYGERSKTYLDDKKFMNGTTASNMMSSHFIFRLAKNTGNMGYITLSQDEEKEIYADNMNCSLTELKQNNGKTQSYLNSQRYRLMTILDQRLTMSLNVETDKNYLDELITTIKKAIEESKYIANEDATLYIEKRQPKKASTTGANAPKDSYTGNKANLKLEDGVYVEKLPEGTPTTPDTIPPKVEKPAIEDEQQKRLLEEGKNDAEYDYNFNYYTTGRNPRKQDAAYLQGYDRVWNALLSTGLPVKPNDGNTEFVPVPEQTPSTPEVPSTPQVPESTPQTPNSDTTFEVLEGYYKGEDGNWYLDPNYQASSKSR